ncbi:hypothetical protein MBLNU459_g0074t1 [Dothideomycetes sp. NU459]
MTISKPNIAFILQVKVTFDPKDVPTFLEYFRPVHEKVLAEPECVYFLIGEDAQTPGVFRWTEGWTKDPQWFMTVQEQITKPYYKRYFEVTEPLFTSERIVEAYIPLDPFNSIKVDLLEESQRE